CTRAPITMAARLDFW
nr:immunoglobulin heavy chain junction region [Macaca mulatta]